MTLRKIEATIRLFLQLILTSKNKKTIYIFSFKSEFYILIFRVHVIVKKF